MHIVRTPCSYYMHLKKFQTQVANISRSIKLPKLGLLRIVIQDQIRWSLLELYEEQFRTSGP